LFKSVIWGLKDIDSLSKISNIVLTEDTRRLIASLNALYVEYNVYSITQRVIVLPNDKETKSSTSSWGECFGKFTIWSRYCWLKSQNYHFTKKKNLKLLRLSQN